ncbi:monovalent cation:proton antiporter-2 (CPA2) family protein [Psychrosphaera aquimarina]|uniref:Monovalent cation:proton antiporter-2 (CPA2) family protein n=1 Tax=Psychrosphaera aquimarina TaxID=2044854 RepID=A0ABU3R4I1_9GAMM|nr:monovalent cation:proton antiporter-2 (CPA2) family protein [Psychrosphaera aquimarina]MDU0114591.1 monovalent cation:proton antiporter-2 (CPA2) family protein [Psychrosphaera aquimarina]
MQSDFILEIIFLLTAAVIAVPICQAFKLGAVPGFLIAGVVAGPFGLGLIHNVEHITHISEFGVVLLLFVIGMELKPSFLWQIKRLVFGLGSLQVLLSGALISALCYYGFALSLPASIIIGPALALSSTAFVLQLLTDQKSLNTEYGRTSVAILLLQDLAVVPLLALIPLLSVHGSSDTHLGLAFVRSISILVAVILVGRYLLNPILHKVAASANSEVFTASAVLIVLGTAYLAELAGLSMAMGAFLAGMLISDSAYRHQIRAEVQPFRGLLLGLFFMSMGMLLNLDKLIEYPLLIAALVTALLTLKIGLLYPLSRMFNLDSKRSLAVAFILAQSGEFALVLFALAEKAKIFDTHTFDILLLVVLISMLITPVLGYLANRFNKSSKVVNNASEIPDNHCVVIAGYGRVGRSIGDILTIANQPFIAIDDNAATVAHYSKLGVPIYYGDVTKPVVLNSAGIKHAAYMVVTVNEAETAKTLVETIHKQLPDLTIYARGHDRSTCHQLRELGATNAVSENIEASIELARLILTHYELDQDELTLEQLNIVLNDYKTNYYKQQKD